MSSSDGWQPISRPTRRTGAEAFTLSPFARLARTHALSIAGDALVVLALADSLFFSLPADEARWRVFGYLALTVAPFAVVAPLIGPALDRATGGRRWMVVGANSIRAAVCVLMLDSLDSLLLFPLAFTVLVMGKGYGVARSALVPTVVRTDAELVEANSKLQLLSGIGSVAAAIPGGLAILIAGSRGALVLGALTFTAATLASLRIPATQVSPDPPGDAERAELRGIGILLAASAMALIRGTVGFLTFLLAFELRDGDAPTWHFGFVIALTAAGGIAGAAVAPALRRSISEERMIMLVLALLVTSGLATAYAGGLAGAAVLGATLAVVSTSGKLAFDSLVQRDAPDANRGRSFARFETRFQLAWVVGAVLPVVIPIPAQLGYASVASVAAFALFSYAAGQKAAQRSHAGRPPEGPGVPSPTQVAGPAEAVPADEEPPLVPDPWGFRTRGPARPGPAEPPPADPTLVDRTVVDRAPGGPPDDGAAADPPASGDDPTLVGLDGDVPDLTWSRHVPGARASDPVPDDEASDEDRGRRRSPVDPTELQ